MTSPPTLESLTESAKLARRVQLSLLVASFACALALGGDRGSSIELAREDLTRLEYLEGLPVETWLLPVVTRSEAVTRSVALNGERFAYIHADYQKMLELVGAQTAMEAHVEFPEWAATSSGIENTATSYLAYSTPRAEGLLSAVATPSDAVALWSLLGSGPLVVDVPVAIDQIEIPVNEGMAILTMADAGGEALRFPVEFGRCPTNPRAGIGPPGSAFVETVDSSHVRITGCATGNGTRVRVSATFNRSRVFALPALAETMGHRRAAKDASEAFPGVSSYLVGSAATSYDVLASDVRSAERLADRSREVSLLGAGIPRDSLEIWGLIAFVALQCYLLVHLAELAKRLRSWVEGGRPFDFPWVSLFPGPSAATLTYLSACLIPVGTVVAITVRGPDGGLPALWSWLGIAASAFLAWRTAAQLGNLRLLTAASPTPKSNDAPPAAKPAESSRKAAVD